jgi:CRP-like cAMP-binding protein
VTDITIGATNFEDQVLGPGDYFGERVSFIHVFHVNISSQRSISQSISSIFSSLYFKKALIHKEPRSANVIGKTKGIALSIDRQTFEKVVGNIAQLTIKAEDKRKLVRTLLRTVSSSFYSVSFSNFVCLSKSLLFVLFK